jgi:uncharacterized membrane protein
MERILLLSTILLTALLAGLFYAWSCSVMPGLARLSDTHYLHAMQAMNRAILNPVFFLSFLGSSALLPLCAWQQARSLGTAGAVLVIAAAVIHWIGMMGVTVLGNIPINNMLDSTDLGSASAGELSKLRAALQGTWVRLNNVRTAAMILTVVLLLIHVLRGWTSPLTTNNITTP